MSPTRRGAGPVVRRERIARPELEAETVSVEAPTAAAAPAAPARTPRRNPLFPVGVTLYPLDSDGQSYTEWYDRDFDADLSLLQDARFALVRVLVSWKAIEPQVGQYSEDALDRLGDLISAAREKKMQSIVCFFADDRHAELVDVAWGKRRDPRTDSYLLQRETALITKVVQRFRADQGVFAWQLANEAFCAGFESAGDLEEWTSQMREAVREIDPERPITLGVDPEAFFRATHVDARAAIDSCEFGVSHVTAAYRAYAAEGPITSGPATYLDAFLLRVASRGLPVLMDDVGALALDNSSAEEAAALRTALWSGIVNGASGAMVRRLKDLDTERREPYFVDPFETLVGLTDSEDQPKPSFDEARAFVRTSARLDLRSLEITPARTAIVMPAERYEPLPNLAGLYDPRACLSAFVAAKEAHVPVTLTAEEDDFSAYSVLVVPSAFDLSDDTWERLGTFVQGGGSLVLSYGGGDAHAGIRDLFGVEFLGDGGPMSSLTCRVAQSDVLGALVSFDARLEVPNYALLSGGTATIVATDAKGSPLLTMNQVGQGRAIYVALPLERAIAQDDPWSTSESVKTLLREVYGAVARAAGCGAPVGCDAPSVETTLYQGESADVLVLINHAAEKVSAEMTTERRVASIADLRGGAPVAVGGTAFSVPIEANGVVVLRLAYA